ncbi:MAG: hypothetical protein MRY72_12095 [Aquisalinus sp.]|nr:hypothetical protein [Aquisalinus sp.]
MKIDLTYAKDPMPCPLMSAAHMSAGMRLLQREQFMADKRAETFSKSVADPANAAFRKTFAGVHCTLSWQMLCERWLSTVCAAKKCLSHLGRHLGKQHLYVSY